ncbi:GNAT family N-acetyltransferase [Sphingomonas carotinifaciens]|uniref:GNAT family N-acetyltransferase n=1 Tax=Sphingomonas carotinifaciens TaxID=1166323 RepID=A0A1G7N1Z5_9SPHN|nr:GNAT family N-acetyltransferase [Sphingomonas carotinifaciens]MBB4087227.1 RimJ/RimL family protein N-acetyltransferase [Sphingomonas carotinifaciens]MWC43088.1 GNAT family N-acetyltransferase [Sphingomonas carotinifaciens]SDF68105.1 Protein N-acetyltransferase, RimJ/RimL family [Sphingomonas carotinifaciens]
MNDPILFTERLILRPPVAEDFEAWAAFHAEPETMRFLGGVQTRSVAWRGLCAMAGAWSIRGFAMFSLIERHTGQWIGRVGPWQPDGWPGREVGWGVARAFAGRGYAHEAACAAMDYAVDVLGWDHVIHTIDPENEASIQLARRLGSRNEGPASLPAPLETFRVDAWGQSAGDWRARKQS